MSKKQIDFRSKDMVLLITGCIRASEKVQHHVIKDDNERLSQYVDSIRYYISDSIFQNIVFCDNSGCNTGESLTELAEEVGKRFEWLSFQGDVEKTIRFSKGYGEDEIIRYALQNSRLLQEAKSFVKVTGRIKISNCNSVFQGVCFGQNLFNKEIPMGRHVLCTRCYCVDKQFFQERLMDCYSGAQEYNPIEFIYFNRLRRNEYRCTFDYPVFVGLAGATGKPIDNYPPALRSVFSVLCRWNMFNTFEPLYIGYRKIVLFFKDRKKRKLLK